ncbi:hypothetical protein CAPTEDRAFT_187056 [Capitella teleta]|uniref:Uncharacterized protein n=1 Tax=Capitella teleta TaxID=283909 RepID=R7TG21_CAPTE|nr:hypothetical protein CAPTEDRAFT_187056 [Capitella teleta]|eukprot:ELT92427.1 hypothetical protein CAPTEDRAFT_187056 [Capitella teleta]
MCNLDFIHPTKKPPPFIVGRVRGIWKKSATNVDFTKNLCTFIFCGAVGLACTIVFSIGLPIAHIVIGTLYLDDCPVQRFIPIYLVVAGCFILVKGIMSIAEAYHKKDLNKDEEYQRPRVFSRADGLVGCFLFCWFIAGNVWIFSNVNKYQSEDPALSNFCNATLYLYAYWVTIATYILMASERCRALRVSRHVIHGGLEVCVAANVRPQFICDAAQTHDSLVSGATKEKHRHTPLKTHLYYGTSIFTQFHMTSFGILKIATQSEASENEFTVIA